MTPSHRGAKRIASSLTFLKHICLSCRRSLAISQSQRLYASAALATSPPEPIPSISKITPLEKSPAQTPQPAYTIQAGVVLSRPPILTPDPHPFETAYYLYQRRLNERLVLPFSQYFYYQRDTPAYERWRAARRARNGVAGRDVGGYNAYDKEGWNDEVLVGDRAGEKETIVKHLIEEEGRGKEFAGEGGKVEMAGLRRTTEADEKGDVRSLERALSRTLYLLVKTRWTDGRDGAFWTFPTGPLEGKEGLKEAAQRILYSSCGPNMYTWFVGNHPIGHSVYNIRSSARTTQSDSGSANASQSLLAGNKTFFMKSRIFRGQADPKGNEMGIEDFKWLGKEEIQKEVSPRYWASVRNMLVEQ